jgi:hypothetical protein
MLSNSTFPSRSFEDFICASELIRQKLENKLKEVLQCKESVFYSYLNNRDSTDDLEEIQVIKLVSNIKFDKRGFKKLQVAFDTWTGMYPDDRMSVIEGFMILFSDYIKDFNAAKKNMIFCSLFIHEFVPILSQPL